ncbi:MAG: molybdenum cofactor guanylyltransferase MobA [Giesbergeria sp.]|jgi:molybdopterin-guanine dinucleotide biosynthesis protein A|nr:molybdenum cofactor guanylyltransferase MobA [Giesbergeria sp.]
MGGIDKGLQTLGGTPLALHALRRLQPQVGPVLINANRNHAAYKAFGVPVCQDDVPGFAGPLAGFLAGLARCRTPWLLAVPCDTPQFPADLASRLARAATQQHADIALPLAPGSDEAHPDAPLRPQPVFCLMRASLHDSLAHYIAGGGRKVGAWVAQQRCTRVPFNQPGDNPHAFFNLNTLDELHRLESAA